MERKNPPQLSPGDDFFRYCNGTWLKNATIPEGKKVYGGIYIATNKAKADVAALYEEDPILRKVVADLGTVTLEENIADLGGVNIALDAYTEHLTQQGYVGNALKDQQRKFFESYADIWCCLYGKELIESRTGGKRPDKHALPRERVNGIVMNIDLWYELYNVTRENLLYLPQERRTHIW